MNVWRLTGAGHLEKSSEPTPPQPADGKVRVRVTKVFLCGQDAALYAGKFRVRYPLIPGRYAVGFIENSDPLLPSTTRVLLNTFRPEPYTGTAKKDFSEDEYGVCGLTRDGFLSDFVIADPSEITPLPENVDDEHGLLAHYVALARAAIEKLAPRRGQHVAVVGADLFGILLCQILIYRQISPILIDSDPARLDFAQSCGIYYTLLPDESLIPNVADITVGKMAGGALYVASAMDNDVNIPFAVSARKTKTVVCGVTPTGRQFDLDLALRKEITVQFSWASAQLDAVWNLYATDAVDTGPFEACYLRPDELDAFFGEYPSHPERDVCEVNIVKLT